MTKVKEIKIAPRIKSAPSCAPVGAQAQAEGVRAKLIILNLLILNFAFRPDEACFIGSLNVFHKPMKRV